MATLKYLTDKEKNPSILVIDDFFSEDDVNLILDEVQFLKPKMTLVEDTNITQLDINPIYTSAEHSNILTMVGKIINPDFINHIIRESVYFRYLGVCNTCSTKMTYSKNGSVQTSHIDASIFTVHSWIRKEDTKIIGGELYVEDFDITIEPKHNRVVFIPGVYHKSFNLIKMAEKDLGDGVYDFVTLLK